MVDVSFIVPSYNCHLTVRKTLLSIFGQKSFDRVKEVIVVDSSDDGRTRVLIEAMVHPRLKVIRLDQKTSPGTGRNLGAKAASGELFCFIDSDVYLSDSWLEQVLAAYDQGCLAGCGSVSAPDFQENNALALAQLYLQFNESLPTGEKRTVSMVPACNMFVQRRAFEKAGGFPDLRASEDVLLCLKLGEFTKVWFLPEAGCFHIFRENRDAYCRNQMVLGKYILIYRRKVYGRWYYQGLWPAVLLPTVLLIKLIRITIRLFKSGPAHFNRYLKSSPLFLIGLLYWGAGFIQGCFSRE
jgi:glycosyltransferase involved in cell wall biosynthesis